MGKAVFSPKINGVGVGTAGSLSAHITTFGCFSCDIFLFQTLQHRKGRKQKIGFLVLKELEL